MDYQVQIVRDPKIAGATPIVKGTRVPIRTILASLAEGAKVEDTLADFPTLTEQAVWAVIAFAAASAEDDLPLSAIPLIRPLSR
jgi:uncharacterized protein (DUF433 family)